MEKGNQLFHKLDKYIGIPIVFILGMLHRKRKKPDIISRIAILNLGSIGDSVLMSAAIADIKLQFPSSSLIVFTSSTNYQLVNQIENVSKVVNLPITKSLKAIGLLKKYQPFDVLIDFGPWPRLNAIYSFFCPAKFKIGFNSQGQNRHYVYDYCIKHSNKIHEIENYRSLVSPIVDKTISKPHLKNTGSLKSKDIILKFGNYCLIHPWPGGYKSYMKEWSNESWVQLIDLIYKDFDKIIITGAMTDINKTEKLISTIRKNTKIKNVISVAGKMNLSETIDIIANAELVFSVNTGIAHIAAAFNIKQVCLHGPTNIKRWRPYSSATISVIPASGKFGYLNYGFEYYLAKDNCMENISVDSVYKAYLSIKDKEFK